MKTQSKGTLILARHGQSAWNQKNLFTGWVDIPLTEEGIQEAYAIGDQLQDLSIDVVFSSSLIRAQMTIPYIFYRNRSGKIPVFLHPKEGHLDDWAKVYSEETLATLVPVYSSWQLNERMYGRLQGVDKDAMRRKYGEELVQIWRRSFDGQPPEGESLAMTAERTLPFFHKEIVPYLEKGKTVLVSAHGNSLRSIVMVIRNLSQEEVVRYEIATGNATVYFYHDGKYDLS